MPKAQGPFEVKIVPQAPDAVDSSPLIGRLTIDKRFLGDLAGLNGTMPIIIEAGKHSNEFDYTLAPPS